MRILIFGLPGSGKTTLARPLSELMNAQYFNADEVRKHYDYWDFTPEGRMRQAYRMRYLCDGAISAGKIAIADFVAPTQEFGDIFQPDFSIWMDTIAEGRFEDTNKMFERPEKTWVNYHVSEWFTDTDRQLLDVVNTYIKKGLL